MHAYTPEIYRRFATPLRLDLGPTATSVEHTRTVVDEIKQDTDVVDSVSKRVSDVLTKVNAVADQATALDEHLTDDRVDLDNARKALEAKIQVAQDKIDASAQTLQTAMSTTADDIVRRVIAGVPHAVPKVNDKSAPLVRLLIQAQANALDSTPDEIYGGTERRYKGWLKNDVELDILAKTGSKVTYVIAGAPSELLKRFNSAFAKFDSNKLPDRSARFAEMDALIHEVAAFLK